MTRRSPEERAALRRDRLEGLHHQLTEGVERLATSDGWKQASRRPTSASIRPPDRHYHGATGHDVDRQRVTVIMNPDCSGEAGTRAGYRASGVAGLAVMWTIGTVIDLVTGYANPADRLPAMGTDGPLCLGSRVRRERDDDLRWIRMPTMTRRAPRPSADDPRVAPLGVVTVPTRLCK